MSSPHGRSASPAPSDGPLQGLRVIDLATIYAGPLAAQLLGDFGADVVKVEHPRGLDGLRGHGPQKDGAGLWWKMLSRNKRTVGINLSDPAGSALLLRMAADADVVIESFRPGTLERWGLGFAELSQANPGLVLVRVSGFGQTGPYASRPGFGTLIEAMSGFAAMTGEADGPPVLPPFGLADGIAGITAAMATLLALYHRDASGGAGQVVDLSVLEPMITVLGPQPSAYDQLGEVPQRHGNRSSNNAPRNTYLTADGRWVAVSSSATSIAQRIMGLIGRPELAAEPWFTTGSGRAAHAELIDGLVSEWIAGRTRDEVLAAFEAADAAIAPVYDAADLTADPHVIAREVLTRVPDPDFGSVLMQNVIARLSATPGRIRFTGRAAGADSDDILAGELGLDLAEVEELRARGVVRLASGNRQDRYVEGRAGLAGRIREQWQTVAGKGASSQTGESSSGVERALDVLQCFGRSGQATLGVTEIADELGISKAVVHRTLSAFRSRGFLEIDESTHRYRLGPQIVLLGLQYLDRIDVRSLGRRTLADLVAATDETATLSVRVGWTRVYIDQVTPNRDVKMVVQLGEPFPLHAGASSKALLAFLPASEQEEYLASGSLSAMTPNTITDPDRLRKELGAIRAAGFAVSFSERDTSAGSVAAPVFGHEGAPLGVISVSGPVERFRDEAQAASQTLLAAAHDLSRRLGYRGKRAE